MSMADAEPNQVGAELYGAGTLDKDGSIFKRLISLLLVRKKAAMGLISLVTPPERFLPEPAAGRYTFCNSSTAKNIKERTSPGYCLIHDMSLWSLKTLVCIRQYVE